MEMEHFASKPRLLIIKACGVEGEELECAGISNLAKSYGMDVSEICPSTKAELFSQLGSGGRFNYIYLSAHGDAEGLMNESNSLDVNWEDFGTLVCLSDCMEQGCLLLLSCCRGGLNQVANKLFYACGDLEYIIGPRSSLVPTEMTVSFHLFLYNITHRGLDPVVASEKIKCGTDIRFVCFDRMEVEAEQWYQRYSEERQKELLVKEGQLGDALKV